MQQLILQIHILILLFQKYIETPKILYLTNKPKTFHYPRFNVSPNKQNIIIVSAGV